MSAITLNFMVEARTAVLAGIDEYGQVAVEVRPSELNDAQRAVVVALLVAQNMSSGCISAGMRINVGEVAVYTPTIPADIASALEGYLASIAALVDFERMKKAEIANQFRADVMAALEEPAEAWVATSNAGLCVRMPGNASRGDVPKDLEAAVRTAEAQASKIIEAKKRAEAEAEAEAAKRREEEELEISRVRCARIERWLVECGNENQRARYARGLLPDEEVLAGIRDEVFAPIDERCGLRWYEPITPKDMKETLGDGNGISYAVSLHDGPMNLGEYVALVAVESAFFDLPGDWDARLCWHRAWYRNSSWPELQRPAIRVTFTGDGMTFAREYAAGEDRLVEAGE